ncbi:MAG: TlpA disulfide reductase family protein [Bacteroidota bacterium]
MFSKNNKSKKSPKKEVLEWAALLAFIGIFYGLGGQIYLQRLALATGLFQPNLSSNTADKSPADFDFFLQNEQNQSFYVQDWKGKVLFINFWATWCPPCVAEMPDINRLYQKVDKEQVVFLMISVDEDREAAKQFMEKKDFDLPLYFMNSPLPKIYDIRSIPTTYVIDSEGKIALVNQGIAQYNSSHFLDFLEAL